PEKAPNKPKYIEIDFVDGIPISIDGKKMTPYKIIEHLNKLGGENGIGRVDIVENRFVGMKSRGVYETPGCTILHVAHRAMESITMDREVMHLRDSLIPKVSELIYYGFWYSPEMEVIKAFINESQKGVTGTVRLKLYKGNCIVVGRKSENSLYSKDFATFDRDSVYKQADAGGFIRLNALRLRIRAMLNK
ncbi:MAG TPA: argininosuccinate synthase, partial [Syntrophorhabdaceae bacterium]|nr:argininosuccinate synthase [Syntrophorhabdaceae bacterium]